MFVSEFLIVVFHNDWFSCDVGSVFNLEAQHFLNRCLVRDLQLIRENDLKHHEQSSILIALLVERHALVLQHLDLAWLYYRGVIRLDDDLTSIEMFDCEL